MAYPAFFDAVPAIRLRDPLAALLGASDDGIVEFRYLDAVKLAGHSCPTVAAAYGMTRLALRALYAEDLPERGGIRVEFAGAFGAGVTGVEANVVSLVTGAAAAGGFKGLGGRYARRHLMDFGVALPLAIRYTRSDGKGSVDAAAQLHRVPASPEIAQLIESCVADRASPEETKRFGALWQERVQRILLDHGDDPEVFLVRRG